MAKQTNSTPPFGLGFGSMLVNRPLVGWLIGLIIGLTTLHGAVALVWGRGPLLPALPWYIPTIHSFVALAALSIAFLAFGRFTVLGEPMLAWLGVAFGSFTIVSVFYVLSWPGLLPTDSITVPTAPPYNLASWFWHLGFSLLAAFLILAHLLKWPRRGAGFPRDWITTATGIFVALVAVCVLLFVFSDALPGLSVGGAFTSLNVTWNYLLLVAFSGAAALSARSYLLTGDSLVGGLALAEVVLAFAVLTSIIGAGFFDLWWYWQRVLWLLGLSIVFGGQLVEYVQLYRRELERSEALNRLQRRVLSDHRRLQVLIDTAPVGIVFFDAPDGRLILANRTAEQIFGQPVVADIGQVCDQTSAGGLFSALGESLPACDLPVNRALRGETCLGFEMLVVQPSGRRVNVLANAAPLIDDAGGVDGVVQVLLDISGLREQEHLREEFLTAAAHELKTPVTSIRGYAQLLQQWGQAADPSQVQNALGVIETQCVRMTRRVQELLEVVELRRPGQPSGLVCFDLAELVSRAVTRVQAKHPDHQLIVLRLDKAPVAANPESIERVVVTLLENAVRRSLDGKEVVVQLESAGAEVTFGVHDGGESIPPDRRPHVFEPFYEAFPSGNAGYLGVVALDLPICKLIVERHQGRVWFESDRKFGTTFSVRLPLASSPLAPTMSVS